jgi:hypothetical protein
MSEVRGVLRTPPDDAWSLHRFDPGPALAPHAVWHWIVTWDLRGREPHHQATLPHPAPHLVDWPRLAVTLGYYDQAHLVREFTATVGTAPARYAAAERETKTG